MSTAASYRLAEVNAEVFAVDAVGNVEDLGDDDTSTPPLVIPPVVLSLTGLGREFGPNIGLQGKEQTAGLDTTRLDRDVTIRAFMTYEVANAINGDRGTVVARGLEDGTATERRLFGLELERVSATSVRIRARWEEISGTDAVVAGVTFFPPSGFFHIACVRRWIDTTTVQVEYILNDELVGSETVAQGDIGEGSGGTLTLGCAGDPASVGDYEKFLPADSIIDQVSIENDAMTVEELRQEFRRITIHQPNGAKIIRAYQPPGDAWNKDPSSRIQKLFAAIGDGVGHFLALTERERDDFLPDRAYGGALLDWEELLGLASLPADSVQDRRDRVLGFQRRILGYQIDDVKLSLEPLFNQDSADIDIIEYDGLRTDDFDVDDIGTPPSTIWRTFQGAGTVAIAASLCTCAASASDNIQYISGEAPRREASISSQVGSDGAGAVLITKIDQIITSPTDEHIGHFWRLGNGDAIVFGIRDNGGQELAFQVITGGVAGAFTTTHTAIPDPLWLLTRYLGAGLYEVSYSATGPLSGFVPFVTAIAGPTDPKWAGFGIFATDDSLAGGVDVDFDDAKIYEPSGLRAFNWQAFRDPADPGTFDLAAAQAQLEKQKPAHTEACAIDSLLGFELGPSGSGKLGCDPLFPADQIVS